MQRRLIVRNELRDLLRHLHPDLKRRIRVALNEICLHPKTAGKALAENLEGYYSYKLSMNRIIYRIQEDAIEIIEIGPRPTIYQEMMIKYTKSLSKARNVTPGKMDEL